MIEPSVPHSPPPLLLGYFPRGISSITLRLLLSFQRSFAFCSLNRLRAKAVPCYDPRYTFVEKLQTISTKYRQQQETGASPVEFMRHYYDVYCLLNRPDVQAFIGTDLYKAHKARRFRQGDNQNIAENEAFILSDPKTRKLYDEAFAQSTALYYGSKPSFAQVLGRIGEWMERL